MRADVSIDVSRINGIVVYLEGILPSGDVFCERIHFEPLAGEDCSIPLDVRVRAGDAAREAIITVLTDFYTTKRDDGKESRP